MNDYNIEAYKRLNHGDCPNCRQLRTELKTAQKLNSKLDIEWAALTEEVAELKAELEAAKKAIKHLIPYSQLYFARNPESNGLTPGTDPEVAMRIKFFEQKV